MMNKLPCDVKGALLEKAPLLFLVSEKLYLDSVSIQNPNETGKKKEKLFLSDLDTVKIDRPNWTST